MFPKFSYVPYQYYVSAMLSIVAMWWKKSHAALGAIKNFIGEKSPEAVE